MKHRGSIIRDAIRNSGMSITELARRMQRSRKHVYNIFENPNVSLVEIAQIGKIIHYDFGNDFEELRNVSSESSGVGFKYAEGTQLWKEKYITLLEKYNELLEEKVTQTKRV